MDSVLTTLLALAAGFALAYFVFMWLHRQHLDDSRAAFWANLKEPLIYISQDIDDDQVLARVANARKKIQEHGNPYLTASDIHFFVFGTDADNAARDFEVWRDLRLQQAIDIRKAFREMKARQMNQSGNPEGAASAFSNQQQQSV
jgi:hypothetical protein